jgi:hypothetical protein
VRPVEVLQHLADNSQNERTRAIAAKALSDREVRLAQLEKTQKLSGEDLENKATQFLLSCASQDEKDVIRAILARAIARLEAEDETKSGA